MDVTELAARRQSFLRIYNSEIRDRKDLAAADPKEYNKFYEGNRKGLIDTCDEHLWIPMSHLWIHDGGKRGQVINGIRRRGFQEAMPYTCGKHVVVPQMCWNCCKTRERITENTPWAERRSLAQQIVSDNKRRKRRRRSTPKTDTAMITDLSDLL